MEVTDRSLFIFNEGSCFRQFLKKVVSHPKFDWVILFFIAISSVLLAIESPLNDPDGLRVMILAYLDYVMTSIFTLEALAKIITYGFLFNGKKSYLRTVWNIIDFLIVVASLISIVLSGVDLSIFKVLRLLRVLRPLRVISRNEGLRISIQSLLMSIPNIINVILITIIFFLIFAIIGVNYFKGIYYYCLDPAVTTPAIVTKFDCINSGGHWINYL